MSSSPLKSNPSQHSRSSVVLSDMAAGDSVEALTVPVPHHVGFIMDGNGRWAKARGLNVAFGHRAGLTALENVLEHCQERGVRFVTCYAFSTENWKRPKEEVGELLRLAKFYLNTKVDSLAKRGVRLRVIGRRSDFSADMIAMIERAEAKTAHNTEFNLTLALSYGGRDELVCAAQRLAQRVKLGLLAPDQIDEQALADEMHTSELPDPDLVIRTSGEMRLSNFLLWQSAYSELYFSPTLWPDFKSAELDDIFSAVSKRDRRFGARVEAVGSVSREGGIEGHTPAPVSGPVSGAGAGAGVISALAGATFVAKTG